MGRDREHWKGVHKNVEVCQISQSLASSRMWWNRRVPFSISNIKVPTHVQQVGDVQSFSGQEIDCCTKVIRVDIHEELKSASVEKGQKLDVSMVDYVFPKSKAKSGQSRVNKTHNSGCLLRVLWRLDHLGPFWMNRSTNDLLATCHSVFYSRDTPVQLSLPWQSYSCQYLNTETSAWGNRGFTTETLSISYIISLYIRLVVIL